MGLGVVTSSQWPIKVCIVELGAGGRCLGFVFCLAAFWFDDFFVDD